MNTRLRLLIVDDEPNVRTSVPQIVVVVILMTASPMPATGIGLSWSAILPGPRNTAAFIMRMTDPLNDDPMNILRRFASR